MAGNIDQDIETIAHAESGEDVRYAIVRAIQDLNQNGGNAQTLNGYSSDEFTKNPQFEQFIDEEVGQIHLVLDAINKGITLRVIELGNKWIGPEANDDVQIQVPDTVRDRQLLTVDDFYADIVEVEGGTGENASWQKSDRYDSALGIYHYAHGALASRVKLHFYAKRASATAVQDYNVHARDRITANDTYTADPGEAWNTVTVDVPIKEEITCNVTENHREYVPTNPGTTSYNKVVVDVPDSLEQGGVVINQATFDQTFTPTSPNVGFSEFRVQADVRFNTQPKEVRISDAEFEDITVTPDSTYAGLSQVSIVNDMQLEEVTVNQNGDVTPGPGYAALKKVTVQVPQPDIQRDKAVTLTTNNTTVNVAPDTGKDAMDSVAVTVEVPEQSIETGRSVTYSSGGTYTVNPSGDYDAMDSVEVTVQTPRLQPSKSVTLSQSGTITPDPNFDAMEEVVVTVSGGGGGNWTETDQATWDAMSIADKKQQGPTVIRNSQNERSGLWFDLTYSISEYLPYSSSIISEAHINNFDAYSHSWGIGDEPFHLDNLLTANSDGIGVDVNGRNGDTFYSDLGDIDTDFTAYLVFRYSTYFAYSAVIGASYQESSGNCAYIIEESLNSLAGVCAGQNTVGANHSTDTYIAVAIRNDNKRISFFKNGTKGVDKIANTVGRYVTIATQYPNLGGYGTNIVVAYAGVVDEAEIDSTVLNNLQNLITKFNIS